MLKLLELVLGVVLKLVYKPVLELELELEPVLDPVPAEKTDEVDDAAIVERTWSKMVYSTCSILC